MENFRKVNSEIQACSDSQNETTKKSLRLETDRIEAIVFDSQSENQAAMLISSEDCPPNAFAKDESVSSQDSVLSQDREFYQLLHRDSQTLENSSTFEESVAAEKILTSWNAIPTPATSENPSLKTTKQEQNGSSDTDTVKP